MGKRFDPLQHCTCPVVPLEPYHPCLQKTKRGLVMIDSKRFMAELKNFQHSRREYVRDFDEFWKWKMKVDSAEESAAILAESCGLT